MSKRTLQGAGRRRYSSRPPEKRPRNLQEEMARGRMATRGILWAISRLPTIKGHLQELQRHPNPNIQGMAREMLHSQDFGPDHVDLLGILADALEDEDHHSAPFFREWYEHSIANDHHHDEPQQMKRPRRGVRRYALSPDEANKRQERFDRWMQWWFRNSFRVQSSLRELERHPDANIRGLAQSIYDPPSDELLHPPDFTLPTGILADLLEDMGHPHAQIYRDWYNYAVTPPNKMREDFSKRPRKRDRERRRKRDERDRWSGFWARHKPQLSQHFAELTAHPNANIARMAQELSESRHTPNVDLTGVLADALADEGHPSEPFFREWYNYAKTPYEGREDFSRRARRRRYAAPRATSWLDPSHQRWHQFWRHNQGPIAHAVYTLSEMHPDPRVKGLAQELTSLSTASYDDIGDKLAATGILADLLEENDYPYAPLFRQWHNYATDPGEELQSVRPPRQLKKGPCKVRYQGRQLPSPEEVLPKTRALAPLEYNHLGQPELYEILSPARASPQAPDYWFWTNTEGTHHTRYDGPLPHLPIVSRGSMVMPQHISSQVDHPEIARRLLTYLAHKGIRDKLFTDQAGQELYDIDPRLGQMAMEYWGMRGLPPEGHFRNWEGLTGPHETAGIMADFLDDLGLEEQARRARQDYDSVKRQVREIIMNTPALRDRLTDEDLQRLSRRRRPPVRYASRRRAPAGGLIFRGLYYPGGRFMPSKRYLVATPSDPLPMPRAAGPHAEAERQFYEQRKR